MDRKQNVLITGIYGFVGTNLVDFFKSEYNLYGLDIVSYLKDGVITTYSWDSFFSDTPALFDIIIHLAGKAHDVKKTSDPESYFQVNTFLTQKIYDFFLQSSAQKFIFFSSVKAAADTVIGDVLREDVRPAPIGPYGESKIKAEEYILSKLSPDKYVYILRPCMIHGSGNKGNLNLLYNVVKKGIPWPLGAFENKRSFTSIENLCFIISKLLEENVSSGIYHISDDEPLSTNELISIMCDVLGKEKRVWKLNKKIMNLCAQMGSVCHLPLNTERLNKLTENYVVSNDKIKQALNIESLPVNARDGLIKTIQSFKLQEKSAK
ncbi:MAG: NAD-dependent epimerase/dehydratase family protein [Clostridiales bacterium]|nr:NAD-dependent epimerase/dehydratase family protein [Clostridiales bacterium]